MHDAASTASQISHIPLDQLQLSQKNVRKVDAPIDDLVASIRAHGLEQNLVVLAIPGTTWFEVIAGGRRLRALQAIHDVDQRDGIMVPCLVLADDVDAEEVSLAENVIRSEMHPADEFDAFKRLVEQGASSDEVAARFGRTALYVDQRLKLARLAPAVLDAYRGGDMTLTQAMALTITEEHEQQTQAWDAARKRGPWAMEPDQLRAALTRKELSCESDSVARYLGVAAYEAGGGKARVDMFGDADDAWLPDAPLAQKLALEKLEAAATAFESEGWKWIQVRLAFDWSDRQKFTVFGAKPYESGDTSKTKWPAEAKAIAGIVVTLERGKVVVHRGLVKPADANKAKVAAAAKAGKSATTEKRGESAAKKPGQLSFATTQRLMGERTAVLRRVLAEDPRRALAALAADLAVGAGLDGSSTNWDTEGKVVVRISADRQFNVPVNIRESVEKHPETKALQAIEKQWVAKLKPGKGRLFAWLLEQPENVTHELLAYCSARTLVAGEVHDKRTDRGIDFATAAGVDMVDHWKPTKEWLAGQPKSVIQDAVAEACGKKSAGDLDKAKGKEALVITAHGLLTGTGWIPKPLRARAEKKAPKAKRGAA